MVIFVAYEGFEMIVNSISDLKDTEKNTEKAYFGSAGFVAILSNALGIIIFCFLLEFIFKKTVSNNI